MSQCNPSYQDAEWSLYRYQPSIAAAGIFCALFAITTILHATQMFKARTWYLSSLVIGGACECIGYANRALNANEEPGCWSLSTYSLQSILILIAPAFVAASIYMILSRIILLTGGESHAIVSVRRLTMIFVSGDIISLLLQASGGAMMASGQSLFQTGEQTIIAGLFIQLACFGVFVTVAGVFHRRMLQRPTERGLDPKIRWQQYLKTLYITSAIIWIRSLFRAIEYINGNKGVLMRSEAYLYIFDALFMLLVFVWLNWFHPSEIGIMLRGGIGAKNGLELIYPKRNGSSRLSIESL